MRANTFAVLSGRIAADEVLAFYEGLTSRGGLNRAPEPPVGRAVLGFEAANSEHRFTIDLYQHIDLTFWTIQLIDTTVSARSRIPRLRLLERGAERAILQNTETDEQYFAPTSAVTEVNRSANIERYSQSRQMETISWASLPKWAQFGLKVTAGGEIHRHLNDGGQPSWNASLSIPIARGAPKDIFEACLQSLDACGLDGSGIERPDRSYYVSVLQWGHSLNAQVKSEAGECGSVTVLNTLGMLSAHLRYWPGA